MWQVFKLYVVIKFWVVGLLIVTLLLQYSAKVMTQRHVVINLHSYYSLYSCKPFYVSVISMKTAAHKSQVTLELFIRKVRRHSHTKLFFGIINIVKSERLSNHCMAYKRTHFCRNLRAKLRRLSSSFWKFWRFLLSKSIIT